MDERKVKISNNFINVTDETIYLYENTTGLIRGFPPSTDEIPETPHFELGGVVSYYILDLDRIEKVRESGRSLADIAYIDTVSCGRNNIPISYLCWAGDSKTSVILHKIVH